MLASRGVWSEFEIYFSNSLIIQSPKITEIMQLDVFGYLMKTPRFCTLNFPFNWVCLRSYIKHSSQCFITISKTWSSSKILSSRCLICDETLCLVFDILKERTVGITLNSGKMFLQGLYQIKEMSLSDNNVVNRGLKREMTANDAPFQTGDDEYLQLRRDFWREFFTS